MPNCIGWIHRELQDFEGAFNFDQQGVDIARHHHVLEAEANSLINLGIDYAHSGEVGKTTSSFAAVDEIFERDAWFRWRYNIRLQAAIADHWLRQGDVARAREFALRLLKTATEFEVHKYVAVAHKLLAQVALAEQDMKTAEREYVTALDELGAFPVPLVTWRVCAELGRLRKQVGDHSGAKELFDQAGEIVRSIANEVSDEKLRATFLNSEVVREALSGTGASSATSQPI
jgi:tetratricopeptide (TPR) repeat protein